MAISSAGVGSGLNVDSIVTSLMTAESQPLAQLQKKEASFQARLSAYGSLKGAISSFQTSLSTLKSTSTYNLKANVGDTSVATTSSSSNAITGNYSLNVENLAQSQKLKSGGFSSANDVIGTGAITIQFGSYDQSNVFTANSDKTSKLISIGSGSQTVSGIRDAINAANVGVTASIVNDGTNYRLLLSSQDTGLENSLKITVADGDGNNTNAAGLSKLAYDAAGTAGNGKNLSETQAAKDAEIQIDGLDVTSSSNTISEAIQGVTINLLKATTTPTTIKVEKDSSTIKTALEGFVKSYNDFHKTVSGLTSYNATTKQAGALNGEATVISIESRVRALLSSSVQGSGSFTTLSSAGISFQKDGTLSFDSTKAQTALDNNFEGVKQLFSAVGSSSDSLVSYAGSTKNTTPGSYAVYVSQLATQGTLVGSQAAGLTITAEVNSALDIKIEGVSASINLTQGNYATATELAGEIESKINNASAFSTAGIKVKVTDSSGILTVTSQSYGATSKVEFTPSAAITNLFGATPVSTAGVNVVGTIDGNTSTTGSGQNLKAPNGLSINIIGGTTGNRGTIKYSTGYASQLDQLLSQYLDTDGLLTARTDGLNATIKSLQKQEDTMSNRLADLEIRYRAQYTALDTTISNMTATKNYLTQQLAALSSSR